MVFTRDFRVRQERQAVTRDILRGGEASSERWRPFGAGRRVGRVRGVPWGVLDMVRLGEGGSRAWCSCVSGGIHG